MSRSLTNLQHATALACTCNACTKNLCSRPQIWILRSRAERAIYMIYMLYKIMCSKRVQQCLTSWHPCHLESPTLSGRQVAADSKERKWTSMSFRSLAASSLLYLRPNQSMLKKPSPLWKASESIITCSLHATTTFCPQNVHLDPNPKFFARATYAGCRAIQLRGLQDRIAHNSWVCSLRSGKRIMKENRRGITMFIVVQLNWNCTLQLQSSCCRSSIKHASAVRVCLVSKTCSTGNVKINNRFHSPFFKSKSGVCRIAGCDFYWQGTWLPLLAKTLAIHQRLQEPSAIDELESRPKRKRWMKLRFVPTTYSSSLHLHTLAMAAERNASY